MTITDERLAEIIGYIVTDKARLGWPLDSEILAALRELQALRQQGISNDDFLKALAAYRAPCGE
jgi:hypothetical protein